MIADAAQRLFLNNSFEKVTVEDIAREAEFGKGTIYQFFESKEDILVYVLCRGIEDICEVIKDKCDNGQDAKEAINNLIEVYYLFLKDYINLFISFVRKQLDGNMPNHLLLQVSQIHQIKMDLMKSVIEKGIDEGIIIAVDSDFLTHAIESTIKGFNLPFFETKNAHNHQENIAIIKNVIFKGILK